MASSSDAATSYLLKEDEPVTTTTISPLAQARETVAAAWESSTRSLQETWQTIHSKSTQGMQSSATAASQWGETVQTATRPALERSVDSVRHIQTAAATLGTRASDGTRALSAATTMAALTTYQDAQQSLANIGSSPVETTADGEVVVQGEATDAWVTALHTAPVAAVAFVGLVSGIASFVLITGRLVDIASLTVILFAPLVVLQKFKLSQLGGMRGQQNRLRRSANELTKQNTHLTQSLDELSRHVASLQQVESKLTALAAKSGAQVDRLVHVVHENGVLQQQIKQSLQAQVIQQLVSCVVQTDSDRDFALSANEVNDLKLTLSCLPGVGFDEVNFQKFVSADDGGLTLQDVLLIVHRLTDDTVDETDHIFHLNPQDVLEQ